MATTVITKSSMNVNRAISAATTVNANCYAIINYVLASQTGLNGSASGTALLGGDSNITRYFGPGRTVPSSFTVSTFQALGGSGVSTVTLTYAILEGVEFINT